MPYEDYNRTIVGFHGTSREKADAIVRSQSFTPSRNSHDWLGHGVYFWEHAPRQALWWAEGKYGKASASVVASMIRLGNCLDLLDPKNTRSIRRFHDELEKTSAMNGQALRSNGAQLKYRDCAVFESYYEHLRVSGERIETTRAVFVPPAASAGLAGKPLWPGTWLCENPHVQICVRPDALAACVLGTWPVRL